MQGDMIDPVSCTYVPVTCRMIISCQLGAWAIIGGIRAFVALNQRIACMVCNFLVIVGLKLWLDACYLEELVCMQYRELWQDIGRSPRGRWRGRRLCLGYHEMPPPKNSPTRGSSKYLTLAETIAYIINTTTYSPFCHEFNFQDHR